MPTHQKPSPTATALVVASFGRHYTIETNNGTRMLCHTRGKSQKKAKKKAAVVGDYITYSLAGDEAVIDNIEKRRNLLYRQDTIRSKVFVANIDTVLLWIAADPKPNLTQINKTLVACEAADIAVQIVLNKADLPQAESVWQHIVQPLQNIGYTCHLVSSKHPSQTQAAWDTLLHTLENKKTFVMGPSGAGKSTFINQLVPNAKAATQEISTALRAGKHTTTATSLYWLNQLKPTTNAHEERTSAIIDSPGFQEFGIQHIKPEELAQHMPDIQRTAQSGCKFHNCTHLHEPGCCVISTALDDNNPLLSKQRWQMYATLHAELNQTKNY